jgi:penicillin-binding protein 2
MNDDHAHDPFWIQDGLRTPKVELESTELIRHEILFEDDVSKLKQKQLFVGLAIRHSRMKIGVYLAIISLVLLVGRAGWMQIAHGQTYGMLADGNRFRSEVLPARRGIIRDRTGIPLAENIPSFDVRMRLSDLPSDDADRANEIALVARSVGISSEEILSTLNTTTDPDEWVDIVKDIPYDQAIRLSIALPDLSGVSLITTAKRTYPQSASTPSLSHILGYAGAISPEEYQARKSLGYIRTDDIGKAGIEQSYESMIRGMPGERKVEVDARGRPRDVVEEQDPVDGADVRLTIDLALQKSAEQALKKGLEAAKVTRGSAIVMNVRNGAILAAVSWPAYDNNIFTGNVSSTLYTSLLENPDRPLVPRAWAGQFPSGSVIKPLIASAALEEGVITPNTTVLSVGGIHVGPWFFPDWKAGGHGSVTVRSAIAWSVNTFFYYIGGGYDSFRGLGVAKLSDWMKKFGLGSVLGLDVAGERPGHVPTEEWKLATKGERWYIGDTYNLSIGQGDLLVTPLQIARVTASIANGGSMVVPHFVEGRNGDPGKLSTSAGTLAVVREGMRDTVVYGSGRRMSSLPFSSAGKTGTAQWRADKPNHAWYTGFAPYEDPEIAVTILLEEGVEGSSAAVPVAYDILKDWWNIRQGIGTSTSTND